MYQSATRPPTLHQWDITDSSALPLPQQKRKLTDVICLVFGVLFGLALLITAIVLHNGGNLQRSQYPTDSKGIVCALETQNGSANYPFLFFNDLQDPLSSRFCVEDCPVQGVPPKCFRGECQLSYYPNYPSSSSLGALCLPSDQSLKSQVLEGAGLGNRFNAVRAVDMVLIGLGVAFGLAVLWVLLVQFLPRVSVWAAFGIAAILLVVGSLVFFLGASSHFADNKGLAIFFGVVFLAFFILLVLYVCLHRRQVELSGCFLDAAGDCVRQNLLSLLYLLLFASLTVLFIVLLVFEYLSFASAVTPIRNGLYYQNSIGGFPLFLLVVQAIWGFSFFRDAFNYVMSGIACEWYFNKLDTFCFPLKRLFCKNIGSVVGGSLLSGIFYLPALLISFVAPNVDFTVCNLFDLARSDVYAYIYLSGNSYCSSSRQTQYLCRRSRICRQNQSTTAIYALAARLAVSLGAVLIVYWITKSTLVEESVPLTVLGCVFLACLFLVSYFSDLHAVVGEALTVCFLTQCDLEEGWTYKEMRTCPQKLSKLVIDIEQDTSRKQ